MKKNRFLCITFFGSLIMITLFLSSIAFSFFVQRESSRELENEEEGYKYKFYKFDPRSKNSYFGFVDLPEKMSDDDESVYEYYEDIEGNHILISNFKTNEYRCYGSCVCENNNNNNRRNSVLLFKRSSLFLVAAITTLSAYSKGKEYLLEECERTFSETCSSSSTPSSIIKVEIDVCKRAEQLELFGDFDDEQEEEKEKKKKQKEKEDDDEIERLREEQYEDVDFVLPTKGDIAKKTDNSRSDLPPLDLYNDEISGGGYSEDDNSYVDIEEKEEDTKKKETTTTTTTTRNKKRKGKGKTKDELAMMEPTPKSWKRWWCEGNCERRKVISIRSALEKSFHFGCEKLRTSGEVWIDEYGVGDSNPAELGEWKALSRFSVSVLEDFCKAESTEYVIHEGPDGSVKEVTEYLCTGTNTYWDNPYFNPTVNCRRLEYYENPLEDEKKIRSGNKEEELEDFIDSEAQEKFGSGDDNDDDKNKNKDKDNNNNEDDDSWLHSDDDEVPFR